MLYSYTRMATVGVKGLNVEVYLACKQLVKEDTKCPPIYRLAVRLPLNYLSMKHEVIVTATSRPNSTASIRRFAKVYS